MKLDSTGSVAVTHEWKMQPVPKDPLRRSELVGVELLLRGQGGCTVKSVFRECDAEFWTHYSPIPSISDGTGAVGGAKLTAEELKRVLEAARKVAADASNWRMMNVLDDLIATDAACPNILSSLKTLYPHHA